MAGMDQPKPEKVIERITKVEEQLKEAEEKKEAAAEAKAEAKAGAEAEAKPAEAKAPAKAEAKPAAKAGEKAPAKPAAAKPAAKKEEKKEEKKREIVLERTYNFSLLKAYARPQTKRGIAAMNILRKLLARHMKTEVIKVKFDPKLADKVRARGHSNPLKYVRVTASKDKEGGVLAKLAAA